MQRLKKLGRHKGTAAEGTKQRKRTEEQKDRRVGFNFVPLCLLPLCLLLTTGCGILNPYKENFMCNRTNNGKCVSVQEAYDESLGKQKEEFEKDNQVKGADKKNIQIEKSNEINSAYEDALLKKLTGLLKDPETPVIAPPQIMRVLMLPYKEEDGELFLFRHVYFVVDQPKWILGDYTQKEGN